MTDPAAGDQAAGPVVPLGPSEYLGPQGAVPPGEVPPLPMPARHRRRAIVAAVVAVAVVVAAGGVLWRLRSMPQWQVMSAAQATMDASGVARVTMSGMGTDDLAYELSWSKDPGATAVAVLEGSGEGRTWVRVVTADGRFYARTDVWSRDMLRRSMDVPPGLADLPSGALGDALEAGRWVELSSPGQVRELAGAGVGLVDDPEARAQLERLRAIAEDGVRGHTSVSADGSDERGDRYRVEVDLAAAVTAHADELDGVLADLAGRWADTMRGQLGAGIEMPAPEVDVRAAAKDLRPLPFTVWVRDGRVAALRLAPHDLDESAPASARLDVEFADLPAPLVPTDAVAVTTEQLQEFADAAFGLDDLEVGIGADLEDRPRLRDEGGRIWITVDKTFAMPQDPDVRGMATKENGIWRDLNGKVLVLTPVD